MVLYSSVSQGVLQPFIETISTYKSAFLHQYRLSNLTDILATQNTEFSFTKIYISLVQTRALIKDKMILTNFIKSLNLFFLNGWINRVFFLILFRSNLVLVADITGWHWVIDVCHFRIFSNEMIDVRICIGGSQTSLHTCSAF